MLTHFIEISFVMIVKSIKYLSNTIFSRLIGNFGTIL